MAGESRLLVEGELQSVEAVSPRAEPAGSFPTLPVLRPRLPSTARLVKYLRQIDERRCYTNYGPLALELVQELSRHLGCNPDQIATVGNATAGITAALLALDIPEGSCCLMPSWTFAATPHAALGAGLTPWFHDVDPETWALDPDAVSETLARKTCPAKAVVVVSPFGAPLDIGAWEDFQEKNGIPVVVDAAAAFDTVCASELISVVSLHATKILGAGEGGFVLAPTQKLRERVATCCNFGFFGSRSAQCRAMNGKMNEYNAAVALASLECWPATRLKHLQIMNWYVQAARNLPGVTLQPKYGQGWVTGTTSVALPWPVAESVLHDLLLHGVESRMWWSKGCHVQPAFAKYGRGDLSVTEALGARVLGLPHFLDMERSDVDAVFYALRKACSASETFSDCRR